MVTPEKLLTTFNELIELTADMNSARRSGRPEDAKQAHDVIATRLRRLLADMEQQPERPMDRLTDFMDGDTGFVRLG